MKRLSSVRSGLLSLGLAVGLLAGCSSSAMSRIDANRALYESWPVDMQQAVFDGKAVKDMTPDMVRMALGKPSRIEPKVGSATDEETWIYEKSDSTGASRPNVAMGGGMGGIGVMRGRRGGGAAVVRAARRARGNSRSSSKTAW